MCSYIKYAKFTNSSLAVSGGMRLQYMQKRLQCNHSTKVIGHVQHQHHINYFKDTILKGHTFEQKLPGFYVYPECGCTNCLKDYLNQIFHVNNVGDNCHISFPFVTDLQYILTCKILFSAYPVPCHTSDFKQNTVQRYGISTSTTLDVY